MIELVIAACADAHCESFGEGVGVEATRCTGRVWAARDDGDWLCESCGAEMELL